MNNVELAIMNKVKLASMNNVELAIMNNVELAIMNNVELGNANNVEQACHEQCCQKYCSAMITMLLQQCSVIIAVITC